MMREKRAFCKEIELCIVSNPQDFVFFVSRTKYKGGVFYFYIRRLKDDDPLFESKSYKTKRCALRGLKVFLLKSLDSDHGAKGYGNSSLLTRGDIKTIIDNLKNKNKFSFST